MELGCDRLGDIGKACARSNRTPKRIGPVGKDWPMLARVIYTAERRIVAVVSGDDAIVSRPHRRFDGAEPSIESFQTRRITGDVAAMSPFRVEINQIDEDQA